jgi:hypothetical protein
VVLAKRLIFLESMVWCFNVLYYIFRKQGLKMKENHLTNKKNSMRVFSGPGCHWKFFPIDFY